MNKFEFESSKSVPFYLNLFNSYVEKHRYLLLLLFFSISCILPLSLMIKQREDPFWLIYQIPQVITEFNSGHVSGDVSPGNIFMIMIFSKICLFPPEKIIFFPIGGIIIPLFGYIVFNKIFNSKCLSLLNILYFSFLISGDTTYSTSSYGLGTILFLSCLFLYTSDLNKTSKIIALSLCFFALQLIYYTSQTFFLLYLFFSTMLLIFQCNRSPVCNKYLIKNLLLSFMVLYFYFNKMFYDVFLPNLLYENNILSLFSRLFKESLFKQKLAEPYVWVIHEFQKSYLILLIWFIIILTPVIFDFLISIKYTLQKNKLNFFDNTFFSNIKYSLILLIFSETVIYAIRGTLMYRMLLMCGPIAAIISLKYILKYNWKIISVLFFILIITAAGMYSIINFSNDKLNKLEETENSIDFLYGNLGTNNSSILTDDLFTLGMYITYGAKLNFFVDLQCIDSKKYSWLTNEENANYDSNSSYSYNYVTLNQKNSNKPLYGYEWISYDPLSIHLNNINKNINLNKIYDDNIMLVYEVNRVRTTKK